MNLHRFAAIVVFLVTLGHVAGAETVTTQSGTDRFVAGDTLDETLDAPGDVFLAGQSTVARGTIAGDLHVIGMDVSVGTATAQDVYALGATVVMLGATGQDLSATGMTVRTESDATVGGNARLLGRSVTIRGAIEGALTVAGQTVVLNAPIAGDARIVAETISFGPEARVGGKLSYSSDEPINVPESVASADRVTFEQVTGYDDWDEWSDTGRFPEMPGRPAFASMLFGFVVSLLFFVIVGAVALGFMPERLERMRASAILAPGRALIMGVIGLSVLFGMVPITGLTIVGLPFVPIALLAIVVAWTLGYALGAYIIAMRIWSGFGGEADPANIPRLVIFAAAITAIALLNFIPFVGWVANYTLVLLGIGAMTQAMIGPLLAPPDTQSVGD